MKFENLVNKIESLPPLSNVAMHIQELYAAGSDNVNIMKLVKLIESDALLTANILRMINAPIYGFTRKIASIAQAVSLFGVQKIYGLVINYSIQEKVNLIDKIYGLTSAEFNEMCQLQSSLMMQWYSKVDLRHAQFLAPLALIMESGKLILTDEVGKDFKKKIEEYDSIEQFEHQSVGTTSYFISALLFEHWNLEPLYVDMLKGLDFEIEVDSQMEFYIDTLDVVRTAINVRDILTEDSINDASAIVKDMGLNTDLFEKIAHRMKENYIKNKK